MSVVIDFTDTLYELTVEIYWFHRR